MQSVELITDAYFPDILLISDAVDSDIAHVCMNHISLHNKGTSKLCYLSYTIHS
jgi:hypothetical protein